MIDITTGISPTALALQAEYLTKLADNAARINKELRDAQGYVDLQYEFSSSPSVQKFAEAVADLEVATPAAETTLEQDLAAAEAAFQPDPKSAPDVGAHASYTAPATPDSAPAPEPLPLQMTAAGEATGFTLEQYLDSDWTEQQLVDAGYAERPKPTVAPGALPAVPSAPAVPAPPAPATSGAELDKEGLPWDARINADAAEKMSSKGIWKRRRNISDEYYEQIKAELRQLMGGAPTPAPKPAAVPSVPAAPATVPSPSVPAPVPSPSAPSASVPATFQDLTTWITGQIKAQKLTLAEVEPEVVAVGLEKLPQLLQRPDLIPTVYAGLLKRLRP